MQLHQRGIDLLVNVQDAAAHIDSLTKEDIRRILDETSVVLGSLLERSAPATRSDLEDVPAGKGKFRQGR